MEWNDYGYGSDSADSDFGGSTDYETDDSDPAILYCVVGGPSKKIIMRWIWLYRKKVSKETEIAIQGDKVLHHFELNAFLPRPADFHLCPIPQNFVLTPPRFYKLTTTATMVGGPEEFGETKGCYCVTLYS